MQAQSIIDEWDEVDLEVRDLPRSTSKRQPDWLRTEKYFRRQRDSKKEIPLRMKVDGKAGT